MGKAGAEREQSFEQAQLGMDVKRFQLLRPNDHSKSGAPAVSVSMLRSPLGRRGRETFAEIFNARLSQETCAEGDVLS